MRISRFSIPKLFYIYLRGICCVALVAGSVILTAKENFLAKPSGEWTEAEALQVLNDSPWAHNATTTVQDTPCDFEHPVYPGLSPEEMAQRVDSISAKFPAESVKPDGAHYLVRLVSVKPMQAAVARLLSLDKKWVHYGTGTGLEPGSKPLNMAEGRYNPADEITVVFTLLSSGPGGRSFLDYALEERDSSVILKAHYLFPCAGLRTANGQIHAVTARMGQGKDNKVSAIVMTFPSIVDGKPLISHRDEKLEFRFILNQRVFETTFVVNPADLFDGTETTLCTPTWVEQPSSAIVP